MKTEQIQAEDTRPGDLIWCTDLERWEEVASWADRPHVTRDDSLPGWLVWTVVELPDGSRTHGLLEVPDGKLVTRQVVSMRNAA